MPRQVGLDRPSLWPNTSNQRYKLVCLVGSIGKTRNSDGEAQLLLSIKVHDEKKQKYGQVCQADVSHFKSFEFAKQCMVHIFDNFLNDTFKEVDLFCHRDEWKDNNKSKVA